MSCISDGNVNTSDTRVVFSRHQSCLWKQSWGSRTPSEATWTHVVRRHHSKVTTNRHSTRWCDDVCESSTCLKCFWFFKFFSVTYMEFSRKNNKMKHAQDRIIFGLQSPGSELYTAWCHQTYINLFQWTKLVLKSSSLPAFLSTECSICPAPGGAHWNHHPDPCAQQLRST